MINHIYIGLKRWGGLMSVLIIMGSCGLYGTGNLFGGYWNPYYQVAATSTTTNTGNENTSYVPGMYAYLSSGNGSSSSANSQSQVVSSKCLSCSGSGKCVMCGGAGTIFSVMGLTTCPGCFGNGKCGMCHGLGFISGVYNSNVDNSNTEIEEQPSNSQKSKGIKSSSRTCSACHGTGYQMTRQYAPNYGGSKTKKYCSICKGTYYSHYHDPCQVCHGTGKVK